MMRLVTKVTVTLMSVYEYHNPVKRYLSPSWLVIFLHISDHQTNLVLDNDNPSKYKMQFLNSYSIYLEKNAKSTWPM